MSTVEESRLLTTAALGTPALGTATAPARDDHSLLVQLVRYMAAGSVAFIIDIAALTLLASVCGVHYLLAAALAFLLGMGVVYVLNVRWVFQHRSVENPHHERLLFFLIGLAGLAMNELVLLTGTQLLGWFYLHSKLVATALVLAWNFTARKIILFSPPRPAATREGCDA